MELFKNSDMKSKLFRLDKHDLFKGVIVAFITAALTALLSVLNSGALPTLQDAKTIAITSITAALAYLVKNLITNSEDTLGGKEYNK